MDTLVPQSICLQAKVVDEDIKTFVEHSFKSGGRLESWSKKATAKKRLNLLLLPNQMECE
jgi:hypothetical protein